MAEKRAFVVIVESEMDDEQAGTVADAIRGAVAPLLAEKSPQEEGLRLLRAPSKPLLEEILGNRGRALAEELKERYGGHRTMGVIFTPPEGPRR